MVNYTLPSRPNNPHFCSHLRCCALLPSFFLILSSSSLHQAVGFSLPQSVSVSFNRFLHKVLIFIHLKVLRSIYVLAFVLFMFGLILCLSGFYWVFKARSKHVRIGLVGFFKIRFLIFFLKFCSKFCRIVLAVNWLFIEEKRTYFC